MPALCASLSDTARAGARDQRGGAADGGVSRHTEHGTDLRSQARPRSGRALTLTTAVLALAWAAPAAAQQTPAALPCDGSLESALADLPQTEILLVKTFRRGEPLVIDPQGQPAATVVEGAPQAPAPIAVSDLCLVKLRVGPGDPGPKGAPSTSAGIGIEILLPDPADWNGRMATAAGPAPRRRACPSSPATTCTPLPPARASSSPPRLTAMSARPSTRPSR